MDVLAEIEKDIDSRGVSSLSPETVERQRQNTRMVILVKENYL